MTGMTRIAAFILASIALAFSGRGYSQNDQYSQGLLVDLYVLESQDDANGPKGRSVATMVDATPNTIGYLEPVEIEPALEQFRDKPWGLHSHGFLKVEESGIHSFNLMMTNSARGRPMTCASWLKIQDRVITSHDLDMFSGGNHNQYGEVTLKQGIYDFESWFGCSRIEMTLEVKPTLTINMRGPNDPMLKPIPNNQLLHQL